MLKLAALSSQALSVFCPSYVSAKSLFLALIKANPHVATSGSFPLADTLTVDVNLSSEYAWLGPQHAENVVVIISGTHGVEGFAGAAIQNDFIQQLDDDFLLPTNTAVLVIFALNPFGFLHSRRCDEQGIDLNRNFIDFSRSRPMNSGYQTLAPAIYMHDDTCRAQRFDQYRQEHGQTAYEIAMSGGQYSDALGPFFGGLDKAHGRKVIEALIVLFNLAQRHLVVLDIHTGLGPYGHGELINDHPFNSVGFHQANTWFGASVTSPAVGDSSSVPKLGLLDYCWHDIMLERGCFVTLEFGTYGTQALFDVILNDHRSWATADTEQIAKSAELMQAHFYPMDTYWRELVLIKGRQVIQQALVGISR